KHSVGQELQRRRHVQEFRRSAIAVCRAGYYGGSAGHRVLPHRRAIESDLVCVEASARVQQRQELRRLVDGMGQPRRCRGREAVTETINAKVAKSAKTEEGGTQRPPRTQRRVERKAC